jgi:peptidoglycan/LPS O-acetylase OafA/YrhL
VGLIRVILAYAVVFNHSRPIHGYFLLPSNAAVTLFFMISGFYMALVLTEKYTGPNRIRNFYSNRVLRLYPMYFMALALMIGVESYLHQRTRGEYVSAWQGQQAAVPWSAKLPLLLANAVLVGSDVPFMLYYGRDSGWHFHVGQGPPPATDAVRMGKYLIVYPAWSIGMELWFYLLAPLLVLRRTRWLVILAFGSLGARLVMEWRAPWSSYFFFPANLCFFVWGMLAYRIYRSEGYKNVVTQRRALVIFVLIVVAIVLRQYIPFYRNHDWRVYLLFGASMPCLFDASKDWRFDRWIGNLSYPIYLIHASVLLLLGVGLGIKSGLSAVLVSTFVALVLLVAVEEPLEKFRQNRVARARVSSGEEPATGAIVTPALSGASAQD